MAKHGIGLIGLTFLAACAQEPAGSRDAAAAATHPGEGVYRKYCISCHGAGIAGAPRTGDAEVWAIRAAKGRELLLTSVINGITPGMPARGLCSRCTDAELGSALDYMLAQSQ